MCTNNKESPNTIRRRTSTKALINKKSSTKPSPVCKICGLKLKSFTALGGHTSKAHPNMSSEFSKRILRREERTFERSLLEAAK